MKISPSILSADMTNLQKVFESIDNADFIHLDVMDGHFVDNINFGPYFISSVRKLTKIPFDVHLMISHPLKYVKAFCEAGSDILAFHIESLDDPKEVIEKIKSFGVKPALVIKPGTDINEVLPYCNDIYMLLVMTVEPGFSGQSFMENQLEKVRFIKEKFPNVLIEVDGGVGRANIELCKDAGVDICVCGTSILNTNDPKKEIEYLQRG